jgi:hypothetical protein
MNTTGEIQQLVKFNIFWIYLLKKKPFRPVLLSLLYTMVAGEKQSFPLRISILYCFQCYLFKNDYGKSVIIQTLLPQSENGLFFSRIVSH